MTLRIGILAEDETDCDALATLVRRVAAGAGHERLGVKKHWLKGCSRLRRKAKAKLAALANDGCEHAILVHDLDRNPENQALNDESELRANLEAIEVPQTLKRVVCIPVEELEAWFWADPEVVKLVGRGMGADHPSPHLIPRPKERLISLSRGANQRPRYSTNDNAALAEKLNLELCAKRCPSFKTMRDFVTEIVKGAA